MFNKIVSMTLLILMSSITTAADNIDVNAEMGKPGQPTRVPKDNEFKVCADQDNLPYSNSAERVLRIKLLRYWHQT